MRMPFRQFAIVICLYLSLGKVFLNAQECRLPILSSFDSYTTSSLSFSWLDFNVGNVSWELEYGKRGFARTGVPLVTGIDELSYTIAGLDSGTSYEIYLRSDCGNESSLWNGPFFANTVIANDGLCKLDLEISDNNCPKEDVYFISVEGYPGQALGAELVLEYVDIIIEHPWPPDLKVSLVAPDGSEISLSEHNGSGLDDYGKFQEDDCSLPVRFTDNACQNISESKPPFIGEFQAEEAFSQQLVGTPVNGIWELRICDRATYLASSSEL